jgi:hypothetical protein
MTRYGTTLKAAIGRQVSKPCWGLRFINSNTNTNMKGIDKNPQSLWDTMRKPLPPTLWTERQKKTWTIVIRSAKVDAAASARQNKITAMKTYLMQIQTKDLAMKLLNIQMKYVTVRGKL